jgi:hypothetical protein
VHLATRRRRCRGDATQREMMDIRTAVMQVRPSSGRLSGRVGDRTFPCDREMIIVRQNSHIHWWRVQ